LKTEQHRSPKRALHGGGRIGIYPGQYFDAETGLHYNYHRYYDPGTGRYLTPDPIGQAGGINLYSYVLNNPVNSVDTKGLVGEEVLPWVPELPGLGPAIPVGIGVYIAIKMHRGEISLDIDTPETLVDDISFKKKAKRSKHERATDVPDWVRYYPTPDPNQNCHDWAAEILIEKYGCDDPRALKRGPGSEHSKIKKWCQRHLRKK
jgi:RHS repeat-associated protein